jgi:hypothetical protein
MKTNLLPSAAVAGLLFALAVSGWAVPPRQHRVRGVIESVDWAGRQITLKPAGDAPALVLAWTDRTRFTRDAGCAKCSLDVGRTISAYYRQEVGRKALREVGSDGGTCLQGQR